MSQLDDAIAQAKASMDLVDAATTKIADAATAIQTRITDLLSQIASAPTLQAAQDLATQAAAEAAKLSPLADSLTAMGTDVSNPVPVQPPAGQP